MASTALAVHATKLFQLDGDGAQATNSYVGSVKTGLEDWDNICAAHLGVLANTPGPTCHKAPNVSLPSGTIAKRSAFITDAFIAGTQPSGSILAAPGSSAPARP